MKVKLTATRFLSLMALLPALMGAGLLSGCSIKKLAINQLGDALAASGDTFASDDDPELVKAALPFSLKLIESLLAESPRHPGLLLAACRGFTLYGYGFVQQDADELQDVDLARADALRDRARRLYLRARGYGLRGLEGRHPGFEMALRQSPKEAAARAVTRDVPLLFWTAAAWGAAISVSMDSPEMISDQTIFEALIDRALALDESFDQGAVHALLIGYEMSRQGRTDDPAARARGRFNRAMELSGGRLAAPLVALAESVAVPGQDRSEFESLLRRALAVDADAAPASRQMNLLAQRRARWLLGRADELFFTPSQEGGQ